MLTFRVTHTKVSRAWVCAHRLAQPLKLIPRGPGAPVMSTSVREASAFSQGRGTLMRATWHLPWISPPVVTGESSLHPQGSPPSSLRSSPAAGGAFRRPGALCCPQDAKRAHRDAPLAGAFVRGLSDLCLPRAMFLIRGITWSHICLLNISQS